MVQGVVAVLTHALTNTLLARVRHLQLRSEMQPILISSNLLCSNGTVMAQPLPVLPLMEVAPRPPKRETMLWVPAATHS